jgi:hypothetical protein
MTLTAAGGVPSGRGPNNPPPTGPNEVWWAPHDPTQVPDGARWWFRSGLLSGFFGTTNIFKCPVEPQWQCGYGMNYSEGSPMGKPDSFVTQTSERLVIWDHRRSPCSDSRLAAPPRRPGCRSRMSAIILPGMERALSVCFTTPCELLTGNKLGSKFEEPVQCHRSRVSR